jgi:hypothetical protein
MGGGLVACEYGRKSAAVTVVCIDDGAETRAFGDGTAMSDIR